jgi:hypothetical protein
MSAAVTGCECPATRPRSSLVKGLDKPAIRGELDAPDLLGRGQLRPRDRPRRGIANLELLEATVDLLRDTPWQIHRITASSRTAIFIWPSSPPTLPATYHRAIRSGPASACGTPKLELSNRSPASEITDAANA